MENKLFFQCIIAELQAFKKNKILLSNAFFLLLLVLLIGSIYQRGVLDRIPTVVIDMDQTSTSRLITRQFRENEKFQVSFQADYPSAMECLKRGEAVAAVVIPPGLAEAVKGKTGGEVLLMVDGTNYITANSVYSRASEILVTLNAGIGIKTLEGMGIMPGEAAKIAQGIKLEQKILYNPDYNYAYYLSYGIIGAGIFSLAMTAFALSLCTNKQEKKLSKKELAAKAIVFSGFICLVMNLLFSIAQKVFCLPDQGSYLNFFLLTLGYSVLIVSFALMLFAIARQQERIFQLGVFFATSIIFTTGYTWPLQSIPKVLLPIYYLNPLTPFLNGTRVCLVMGADWVVLVKYIMWQLLLIALYLPLGFTLYMRGSDKFNGSGEKLVLR